MCCSDGRGALADSNRPKAADAHPVVGGGPGLPGPRFALSAGAPASSFLNGDAARSNTRRWSRPSISSRSDGTSESRTLPHQQPARELAEPARSHDPRHPRAGGGAAAAMRGSSPGTRTQGARVLERVPRARSQRDWHGASTATSSQGLTLVSSPRDVSTPQLPRAVATTQEIIRASSRVESRRRREPFAQRRSRIPGVNGRPATSPSTTTSKRAIEASPSSNCLLGREVTSALGDRCERHPVIRDDYQ